MSAMFHAHEIDTYGLMAVRCWRGCHRLRLFLAFYHHLRPGDRGLPPTCLVEGESYGILAGCSVPRWVNVYLMVVWWVGVGRNSRKWAARIDSIQSRADPRLSRATRWR